MIGTSGGGFDLMAEGLSLQGQSEIPLTVYLAARPGPATGVPTYTAQSDLNIALSSGHGEFPRVVIAPGNSKECIEKTNEAIHLAEKFNTLSIVLSDKHIAESQFSFDTKIDPILKVPLNRKIPGKSIVRSNGYEHDANGNTIESAKLVEIGAKRRISNYKKIQKYCNKFQMVKIYGPKKSKNLVVGWGSTKSVILDSIKGLDVKFLQVLYLKPMSKEIKKYIESSKNVILVENNSTGQLGRAIREKTGIKIDNKILRYDGRPFNRDELKLKIEKMLK
jgi:2-oxoglutarate ferredoxin oxidoreductase subunit alpha